MRMGSISLLKVRIALVSPIVTILYYTISYYVELGRNHILEYNPRVVEPQRHRSP